jgi:predicted O-methyltransferase YrrM
MSNFINDNLDSFNWFQYSPFYDWISYKNYTKMAEVGVWKGHSISYLANRNPKSEIYAIDLFEDSDISKIDNKLQIHVDNIYQIYNKNLELSNTRNIIKDIKSCSWDAAFLFEDNYFDFVFIDADHEYDSVKKDIEAWFPKVKKGGILAGHDYGYPKWPGVKIAVDEFSLKNNLKVNSINNLYIWYYEI